MVESARAEKEKKEEMEVKEIKLERTRERLECIRRAKEMLKRENERYGELDSAGILSEVHILNTMNWSLAWSFCSLKGATNRPLVL